MIELYMIMKNGVNKYKKIYIERYLLHHECEYVAALLAYIKLIKKYQP